VGVGEGVGGYVKRKMLRMLGQIFVRARVCGCGCWYWWEGKSQRKGG